MGFNTFPCNPYPISTAELNKGNNDDLNARVAALESDVSDLDEQKANQITIALPFNPETTYEVGDLVYYNGLSYRCTNEHTGEWDADDFAGTTIANELSDLKSGLTEVNSKLNGFVVCACDIEKYSTYITAEGVYNVFKPYYVAKIPVVEDTSILVKNAAQNGATYNKFVDINGDLVGSLIQNNNEGTPLTLTVPTGAVALLVTMFVTDGVPRVELVN